MNRSGLLDSLEEGTVVLTANARLARNLAEEYERRMLDRGRDAWPTPSVVPLGGWLLETYLRLLPVAGASLPRLLTPEQEQQLWASVIRSGGPGLLRVDAAADRARAAWKLLRDWQLDLDDRRFGDNEDGQAFRRWATGFRALCEQRGFASESDVAGLLAPFVAGGACRLPARLLLAGFYDPAPAQHALVAGLRQAGCDARWVELSGRRGRARRLRADDAEHEVRAAAEWARQILVASPESRIGIVVPDLAARRSSLAHRLGKTLDPAWLRPGTVAGTQTWNLSLGVPLAQLPIVRTALDLLALMQPPVDTAFLGVLLGSPHWSLPREAGERRAELGRRALLDRRLRSLGDAAMPLSAIRYEAGRTDESGQPQPWACPALAVRLGNLAERLRAVPGGAETGAWATAFTAWLGQAGWPLGRPLDSAEFQAVEAWNELLSRFSAVGDFAGSLSRGEALALLRRLAGATVFQPRAAEAPVQVLGLYEANGLEFDHLWVMGLQDTVWPPAPNPDPFIPLSLQREHGMPHCAPEREWEWATRVTAQLGEAAAEVVFSWPAREGSEELACSPLIGDLPEARVETQGGAEPGGWFERIRESTALEPAPASVPIVLRQPDVPGGSRLFAHQAACPFRALAEHRLGARPLDRPVPGLGAKRSGTLMHRVLEKLWRELETQAALLALDEAALSERVRAAVNEVLEAQRRRSPATLPLRYRTLEADRLVERALDWLRVECQRSPFRVVDLERRQLFETGGVRVKLFLDRIDELDDGARVVLDYKTGEVRPSGWFGARPDDPQLPLYGVASRTAPGDAPLAAVAFAQIRPDWAGFSGVVSDAGVLPGLPVNRQGPLLEATATWPRVLDEWSAELERLAIAFREGRAEVDPKHGLDTCRKGYCELAPLCRIRERLPAPGEDTGGDAGDD